VARICRGRVRWGNGPAQSVAPAMRSSVERPPVWEDKRARSDESINSDGGLLLPDSDA
jgi:hypothetical protein